LIFALSGIFTLVVSATLFSGVSFCVKEVL
jgi:hypothetical protein